MGNGLNGLPGTGKGPNGEPLGTNGKPTGPPKRTGGAEVLPFDRTTEYTAWTPPDTQDLINLRNRKMSQSIQPLLQSQFDQNRVKRQRRNRSLYGQNRPQEARDALTAEGERDDFATYGGLLRQQERDFENERGNDLRFLAQATLPRPLQSREFGYQTGLPGKEGGGGLLGGILGAAGPILGALAEFSDERMKQNIHPQSVLPRLDNYQAKSWDWKEGSGQPPGHEVGVVAQDMDDSFPEAAIPPQNEEQEPWMVDYGKLGALALQGVKELNSKVDALLDRRNRRSQRAAA